MDKITVVCHKDHDKGYEDFQGKCLLCEVERLQKREWVGLTDEELREAYCKVSGKEWCLGGLANAHTFYEAIEAKLKEKNA